MELLILLLTDEAFFHARMSALLFVAILLILVPIVDGDCLPNATFLRPFKKRETWKRYDYVWYTSAFFGVVFFAIAFNYSKLEEELAEAEQSLRVDFSLLSETLRDVEFWCSALSLGKETLESLSNGSRPGLQGEDFEANISCLHPEFLKQRLATLSLRSDFPAVRINESYDVIEYESTYSDFELPPPESWQATLSRLKLGFGKIISSTAAESSDLLRLYTSDGFVPVLAFPPGRMMDRKVERAKQLRNEIAQRHPFRFQNIWWMYVLSFLIALKVVKTRAEVVLKE